MAVVDDLTEPTNASEKFGVWLERESGSAFFPIPEMIPTAKKAATLEQKSTIPSCKLPNMGIATLPIKKAGPALTQKQSNLEPVSFDITFSSVKAAISRAPTG